MTSLQHSHGLCGSEAAGAAELSLPASLKQFEHIAPRWLQFLSCLTSDMLPNGQKCLQALVPSHTICLS